MINELNAAERLVAALKGSWSPNIRIPVTNRDIRLKAGEEFPTGIINTALSVSKDRTWWFVEVHFLVGNTIVLTLNTARGTLGGAMDWYKILSSIMIHKRPSGPAVQRLYKKHKEYKILQEIIDNVDKESNV